MGKRISQHRTIDEPFTPKTTHVILCDDGSVYQFAEFPDAPRMTPELRVTATGSETQSPSFASLPEAVREVTQL